MSRAIAPARRWVPNPPAADCRSHAPKLRLGDRSGTSGPGRRARRAETTAREFSQKSSQILAAAARGETVTVTRIGTPVARVVSITENDVPPFPTGPPGTQSFPTSACPISAMTKSRKR
ncbi:type II toxin-antitoxin system prevent-host-death family antitoxin [Streptomyces sp. NPDC048385]|uniref:type II toxin-antitoxin system Phd/YefM family antitoxin n=1 Tax=unclassified Streptomyces TaxID=2593676 RepID=UPI0034184287